uniref:Uncharacterized protein n=1 Tax=viral metagenome TaxID=1070528 RepID=A0A6M3ME93_9ZZZZ
MKWIKIDKDDLPKCEVLAANFQPKSRGYKEKMIGYLEKDNDLIICDNELEMLNHCTHYIDINKFDIKDA